MVVSIIHLDLEISELVKQILKVALQLHETKKRKTKFYPAIKCIKGRIACAKWDQLFTVFSFANLANLL